MLLMYVLRPLFIWIIAKEGFTPALRAETVRFSERREAYMPTINKTCLEVVVILASGYELRGITWVMFCPGGMFTIL